MMRCECETPSVRALSGGKHTHVNVTYGGGSILVRVQKWAGPQFNDRAASMVGAACGGPIRRFRYFCRFCRPRCLRMLHIRLFNWWRGQLGVCQVVRLLDGDRVETHLGQPNQEF